MRARTGSLLGFIIGAAVGSVVTYMFAKKKIEAECNKKIEDNNVRMREFYKKRDKKEPTTEEKLVEKIKEADRGLVQNVAVKEKESLKDFVNRKYHDYATHLTKEEKEDTSEETKKMHYLIVYESGDDYAESQFETFQYYYDGFLIYDEDGEEVKMPAYFDEEIDLDEEFKIHGDRVYIRNELLECDYDIEYTGERRDD